MAILRDEDRERIRAQLAALQADVKLTLVGPSALAPPARDLTPQIRELYGELAALSPRVKLDVVDVPTAAEREALGMEPGEGGPVTVVSGPGGRGKVRYLGAPAGYEFPNLLHALAAAASGASGLSEASRAAVARIAQPLRIRVFFTPTWPYCPQAAGLAHAIALENANVTADAVEAQEFPELAARYGVQGVPKTVVGEAVEFVGAVPEAEFVAHVLRAAGVPA